ncbi:MAG: hypothetical protein D6685_14240 [Bacteroidetes bacterium]|nr:MAG: hypothetical protein D6685_14240 [Bacteroidota bacterium]
MNPRIQPYHRSVLPYTPATPRPDAADRTTARPDAAGPAGPATATPAPDVPTPLSAEEQAMIDRYFPASPTMAMRIYGRGQQSQTITPTALGNRLDLRA